LDDFCRILLASQDADEQVELGWRRLVRCVAISAPHLLSDQSLAQFDKGLRSPCLALIARRPKLDVNVDLVPLPPRTSQIAQTFDFLSDLTVLSRAGVETPQHRRDLTFALTTLRWANSDGQAQMESALKAVAVVKLLYEEPHEDLVLVSCLFFASSGLVLAGQAGP